MSDGSVLFLPPLVAVAVAVAHRARLRHWIAIVVLLVVGTVAAAGYLMWDSTVGQAIAVLSTAALLVAFTRRRDLSPSEHPATTSTTRRV